MEFIFGYELESGKVNSEDSGNDRQGRLFNNLKVKVEISFVIKPVGKVSE